MPSEPMSLVIRPSSRSSKQSVSPKKRRKRKSNGQENSSTPCKRSETMLSDDTVSIFSSPSRSPQIIILSPPKHPSPRSQDGYDSCVDIFDTTAESTSTEILVVSSPELSRSPLKPKNSQPYSKGSPVGKQKTMDRFVLRNYSTRSISKKREHQSKMDLFVKWKDPKKLERADKAREKFFNKTDAPDVHNSSWTVPQEVIDKKFDDLNAPTRKKTKKEKSPVKSPPKALMRKPKIPSPVPDESTIEDSDDIELARQIKQRREMMRKIMDEKKTKGGGGILRKVQEERRAQLKDGQVIRRQEDRQRMHATDCPCCKDYYDALGLSPTSRQKRVQQTSRHRFVDLPKPKTPDHYWDLKFSSPKQNGESNSKSGANKSASKKLFS